MEGVKLWESIMNYLVMYLQKLVLTKVALANIWLLLVLFQMMVPAPLVTWKMVSFGVYLLLSLTPCVNVLLKHSVRLLIFINIGVTFYQWRQSRSQKATSTLTQKVNQYLCQHGPLPLNPLPKGRCVSEKEEWEYFKLLVNDFPLIWMTHISRNGL